jgi:uncharacterized protein (DUF1697 family)
MSRYVALLRGINLGKRRVKMEDLKVLFEALKFDDVSTFIASGNVFFTAKTGAEAALVKRIETHLQSSLGYAVDTYVRSAAEMRTAADRAPFGAGEPAEAHTLNVTFLREPLDADLAKRLLACGRESDQFAVAGRELYWLRRDKSAHFDIWATPEVRALKLASVGTMRNITSVRKMADLISAV